MKNNERGNRGNTCLLLPLLPPLYGLCVKASFERVLTSSIGRCIIVISKIEGVVRVAISLKRRFMTDLQIRIDTNLKETLRVYADENGYSMADVIRVALVEKFTREKFLTYARPD